MQLAAITPAEVRDWHSGLLPGKPTMRARTYALLRAILNTAITDELIDRQAVPDPRRRPDPAGPQDPPGDGGRARRAHRGDA